MADPTRASEAGIAPPGARTLEFSLINKFVLALRVFITGFVGLFCMLSVPAFYFDWEFVEQYGPGTEFLLGSFFVLFGLVLLRFSVLCLWRLLGPDFDVRILDNGLQLHPSQCRSIIPWKNIQRSRVRKRGSLRYGYYDVLELELTNPILPPTWPLPTRKVAVTPLSGRTAEMGEIGREVKARRLAAGSKR